MGRSTTRIQNLTLITADNIGGDDIIPIGPSSGDRAKGTKVSELEKRFESDGLASVITETSVNYTALITDNYVVGLVAGITLGLPFLADANRVTWLVNGSASNQTIDGGAETVPNGTVLSTEQVRGFLPTTIGWREV